MIIVRARYSKHATIWRLVLSLFLAFAANCQRTLAQSAAIVNDSLAPASAAADFVAAAADLEPRVALWPWQWHRSHAVYDSAPGPITPHPAVARIIVPEDDAIAYGSGTLVDARDQYGLVVTNWHVVRDSTGKVEVVFPSGFRSQARPLKVDKDWDLAALVIWRPPIEPVRISAVPPRPGDLLTIHGYGQGQYRIATGHCTQFFAPREDYPCEMVELDVEARQGDSGGPIFNDRGEIAGVLFGAGEGTTIGSFAPRVQSFLASLAPDIGQAKEQAQVAVADRPAPDVHLQPVNAGSTSAATTESDAASSANRAASTAASWPSSPWPPANVTNAAAANPSGTTLVGAANSPTVESRSGWHVLAGDTLYDGAKSALAVVGMIAVALQLVRAIK
jgi:hypothetical protein